MKDKYVILEMPGLEDSLLGEGGPMAGPAFDETALPRIEVDEMPASRAAEMSRRRSTTAVAPVMPMKLIAPVAMADADPADNPGPTWGIQAVGADTSPFTGAGIVVAVLDTGIDPTHPAFAGVELVRRNFTGEGDDDIHGHGTHCAGTIFGRDVDGVRIGVARGVTKALIGKVLGEGGGGSDQIVQAINWAVQEGANVISMSLGIDFPGYVSKLEAKGVPIDLATSMALVGYRQNVNLFAAMASLVAAQGAFGKTALLIAAAGNESRRQVNPDFDIAVAPPGPGVGIVSAKLGGGLASMSGTSMAAPHVAGVAALWAEKLQEGGFLEARQLEGRLAGNASDSGMAADFDPYDVGAGMVLAPQD